MSVAALPSCVAAFGTEFMSQTTEPTKATAAAPRKGILERLKSQTTIGGILDLCAEFDSYEQASQKTVRRFGRIITGLLKTQDSEVRKEWKDKLLAAGYGGQQ